MTNKELLKEKMEELESDLRDLNNLIVYETNISKEFYNMHGDEKELLVVQTELFILYLNDFKNKLKNNNKLKEYLRSKKIAEELFK